MNDFFEKLNEKYSEIMGGSVDFIRGEEKRIDIVPLLQISDKEEKILYNECLKKLKSIVGM